MPCDPCSAVEHDNFGLLILATISSAIVND